jgi:hypothetical protein
MSKERTRPRWPTRMAPPKAQPTPIAEQPPAEDELKYKGNSPRLKARRNPGTRAGIDRDWDKD